MQAPLLQRYYQLLFTFTLTLLLLAPLSQASAAIQVLGTRVIFSSDKKETSIKVNNPSQELVLLQTWIDPYSKKNESADQAATVLPFFVTPPLGRLDAGQSNTLRIRYTGEPLATDRESVFGLNIKEIPQTSKVENVLQFAINTRIKLFFRPSQLTTCADKAYTQLQWSILTKDEHLVLQVDNPSPCFITISDLLLNSTKKVEMGEEQMIGPFNTTIYRLEKLSVQNHLIDHLSYQTINDYGGNTPPLKVLLKK